MQEVFNLKKTHSSQPATQQVHFMIDILEKLNFVNSAATLRKETGIDQKQSIQKYIQTVQSYSYLSNEEKRNRIKQKIEQQFLEDIKKQKLEEATKLYEQYIPVYFENLEEMSMYFIEPPKIIHPLLNQQLQQYIMQTNSLPTKNQFKLQFNSEIWFVKNVDEYILVIDKDANAKLIKQNEIAYRKQKIHNGIVTCVKTKQSLFATGGDDEMIRVWNLSLDCLRVVSIQKGQINAIAFTKKYLVVGGGFNYLSVCLMGSSLNENQELHMFKVASRKCVDLLQYGDHDHLIVLTNRQATSQISFINITRRKQEEQITCDVKIFNLELSKCRRYLYANCFNSEIRCFSLENHQLIRTFTGYLQENSIMRMACGGKENMYLAVTSQNGFVLIFHRTKNEPPLRIQTKSGVNDIVWVGNTLYFGCDDGSFEKWSNYSLKQKRTFGKEINGVKHVYQGEFSSKGQLMSKIRNQQEIQ